MFNKTIMAAAFGALALLPLGASASTLDTSNTIMDGGSYNMIGSNFFGETFLTADVGGSRSFTFNNLNTVDQNIALTVATVSALAEKFTGGVTFTWLVSGLSLVVADSVTNFSGALDNVIAAGSSDTLVVTFGDPEKRTGNGGRANFTVSLDASPVPLPAGGLLLVAGLGGLASLRRRKSV
jgi:hypothetical protein